MLAILPYVGDALWILVMATIASTSRAALARIPRDVRTPLPFAPRAGERPRGSRNAAFAMAIGAPLLVGLALLIFGRLAPTPEKAMLVFLVRTATAPLFALAHLAWLRGALRTLDDEGALRP